MFAPATTLASLLLLILALFCWGSWANTQKLVFKWRFELFYYDFALGVLICIFIAAYTLGSMNTQDLTISDNMMIAGYRKIAYGLAAGLVVNLATLMLVAAISVSGLSVAFPIAFGMGLVVMSVTNFIENPQSSNPALLFFGLLLMLGAVAAAVLAYRNYAGALAAASRAGKPTDSRMPIRGPIVTRGTVLSLLSGIIFGFFFPLADASRSGDNGVAPYGLAALIGAAMFASTLLYVPFFLNFPVQGEPVRTRDYFKGAKWQHVWGILGGFLWAVGLLGVLIEYAVPAAMQTSPFLGAVLVRAAPFVAALWGLLAWREFKGATQGVKMLLLGMLAFYALGVGMTSLAVFYAAK